MFKILILLAVSVALGYSLRKVKFVARFSDTVQYTVYVMLFVFGLTIGSNPHVMDNLGEFGLQAVILAASGIAGSIVFIYLFNRLTTKKGGKR